MTSYRQSPDNPNIQSPRPHPASKGHFSDSPFDSGYCDFIGGAEPDENPFPPDSPEYKEWFTGWKYCEDISQGGDGNGNPHPAGPA